MRKRKVKNFQAKLEKKTSRTYKWGLKGEKKPFIYLGEDVAPLYQSTYMNDIFWELVLSFHHVDPRN